MKIDNSSKPVAPSTTSSTGPSRARTGAPPGSATTASTAPSSTEANLSGLQGLSSVLASTPVMDAERVAEIKQAIAEGRFQVNPERIAEGLLRSVQDMLDSQA